MVQHVVGVRELEVVMVTRCCTASGCCHGNMLLWYRSWCPAQSLSSEEQPGRTSAREG